MANRTENLDLDLDFLGHVQTEQALAANFKKIDEAVGAGGGGAVAAEDVSVTAIADATGTDVQAVLADLAARVKALEDAAAP